MRSGVNGIVVPLVNINGTLAVHLAAFNKDVLRHLVAAALAHPAACPHGRDYPDGDLDAAMAQHRAMGDKLMDLVACYTEVTSSIQQQAGKRRPRAS